MHVGLVILRMGLEINDERPHDCFACTHCVGINDVNVDRNACILETNGLKNYYVTVFLFLT